MVVIVDAADFVDGSMPCLRCGAELWFTSAGEWGEIRVTEPLERWRWCFITNPDGTQLAHPQHEVLDLHDPELVERWLAS